MDSSSGHPPVTAAAVAPVEPDRGLGAEVRASLLLLGLSAAVTAAVAFGAPSALHLLG